MVQFGLPYTCTRDSWVASPLDLALMFGPLMFA